jgi:hypothetical protein
MPIGLGTALQVVTAVLTTVVAVGGAALAWYIRNHIVDEVERNSEFRRYAGGTTYGEDDGKIGDVQTIERDMEHLSQQMDAQHEEVVGRVDYAITYCRRIARAVDADIPEPERTWQQTDD